MSAQHPSMGGASSHSAHVKAAPNAASGDAACNPVRVPPVGRVPSHGAAPTGQKKIAQGKERSDAALGHKSQNTSSPEGAKEGGELPEAWVRAPVGELFQVIGGGTPPTSRREFWSGSIPWITSADIGEDH